MLRPGIFSEDSTKISSKLLQIKFELSICTVYQFTEGNFLDYTFPLGEIFCGK